MTCSDNTCGTGIGSVILPGDPSNDSILTALPVFGGVELSWQLPSTNSFAVAYTKIWRSYTNNFNGSLMIAQAAGDRFFDRNDFMNGIFSTLYYWIQFVSINGTVGDPIGPAAAIPRATIDQLIEQLTAKIDYGALSVNLKTTVDKADAYKLAQDLVNGTVSGEQASMRDALALVQSDLENTFVLISNEVVARQNAEAAFASSINLLAVSTEDNFAAIQQTFEASIDDTNDVINSLYTVKLTADGLVGGFGLTNNGDEVEAGFDVDTFWVGRTNDDKKKPFIIADDEVFINQAAIQDASISLAKIDKATIQNLSAINANMGTITAGSMTFYKPGDATSYISLNSSSQTLTVVNAGVVRVRIGNLG